MTERRGDPGYSVSTRRLGGDGSGGQSRRRSIISILIVVVAVSIVGISVVSERLAQRPSLDLSFLPSPTPRPSPSPTSTRPSGSPEPTDLPLISRGGDEIRSGQIPFVSDAFHLLDMASGHITDGPAVVLGRDLVFRDPVGDGWLCVCGGEQSADGAYTTTFQLIRIPPSGDRAEVLVDDIHVPATVSGEQQAFDIDLTPDHRRGLIAVAAGQGTLRPVAVASFDAVARTIGDFVPLPEPPSAGPSPAPDPSSSPSPELSPANFGFDGPHIRLAPDGRTAIAWDLLQVYGDEGLTSERFRTWRIDIGPDGSIGEIGPAPGFDDLPRYCQSIAWIGPDRLMWSCPVNPNDGSGSTVRRIEIRVLDRDGRTLVETTVESRLEHSSVETLIDRAAGVVYLWDEYDLQLTRLDIATLTPESVRFDPASEVSTGVAERPLVGTPDWATAASAVVMDGFRALTPSADGTKLLLIGYQQPPDGEARAPINLGVFVVDRSTLALVDRWAPAADYFSISVLADGRSVALGGASGVTADGQPAPWQSSLTIHDISDGRIVARYGRLGENGASVVVPP